jgi:putative FmdB family regulatory protein
VPTYEYECLLCEKREELVLPIASRNDAPMCCGTRMGRVISAPHVNPDIAPYKAVAGDRAGQWITSRKEHKEFLKRNRFTEVGNEPIRPIKNDFRPRKGEIVQELKRVVPQILRK